MIVLQETVSRQTFNVIPRSYTADSMDITDEGGVTTNYALGGLDTDRVDYNGTSNTEGTYLEISNVVSLTEGKFYDLAVKNGSTVIYRDKIFCTNQTVSSYSINNGEYTEQSSNSDFIIL